MYNDMMGPPYVFPGILGETSRGIHELLVYPEPRWPYERGHLGIGDGAESRVGLVFTFGWQQRGGVITLLFKFQDSSLQDLASSLPLLIKKL